MAELVGPGAIGEAGATSVIFSTPFPHRPGDRAKDRDGNEYLFVDFTATTYYGCLVQINSVNQAAPLLGTAASSFRVGVVCSGTPSSDAGNHPTSDNGGWVQIYGVHPAVQTGAASGGLVSDSSVAGYWCIPQTSVGTPSGVLTVILQGAGTSIAQSSIDGNVIYNMWLVNFGEVTDLANWPGSSGASGPTTVLPNGETSGTNTSAFIGQTYAVFLNFPYVLGNTVPLSDATS
jgi:hypothetical protein